MCTGITTLCIAGILLRSFYKRYTETRTENIYKTINGCTKDHKSIKGSINGSFKDYGSINGSVKDFDSSTKSAKSIQLSLTSLKHNNNSDNETFRQSLL